MASFKRIRGLFTRKVTPDNNIAQAKPVYGLSAEVRAFLSVLPQKQAPTEPAKTAEELEKIAILAGYGGNGAPRTLKPATLS